MLQRTRSNLHISLTLVVMSLIFSCRGTGCMKWCVRFKFGKSLVSVCAFTTTVWPLAVAQDTACFQHSVESSGAFWIFCSGRACQCCDQRSAAWHARGTVFCVAHWQLQFERWPSNLFSCGVVVGGLAVLRAPVRTASFRDWVHRRHFTSAHRGLSRGHHHKCGFVCAASGKGFNEAILAYQ
jgi:hypothetical protein